MKRLFIGALKKPLKLLGWKFVTEPTLSNILISYLILFFIFSVLLHVILSYLPVSVIYSMYLSIFWGLILFFASMFHLFSSLRNFKFTSVYFLIVILSVFICAISGFYISNFMYDNFGFKREIIETKLTKIYSSASSGRSKDITCSISVRAEIDNKIYSYECFDPNTELLSGPSFDKDDVYLLTTLPNSQVILKAEKAN